MANLKTTETSASVAHFLDSIEDDQRRADCKAVSKIMQKATGAKPKMWGASIVGFGNVHYKYASGREGDWMITGFSPRKDSLTLYLMSGVEQHAVLLKKLGKHKLGKGCLYIKTLSDVDTATLEELIKASVARVRQMYPSK